MLSGFAFQRNLNLTFSTFKLRCSVEREIEQSVRVERMKRKFSNCVEPGGTVKAKLLLLLAIFAASAGVFAQPENPAVRKAAQQFYRNFDTIIASENLKALKSVMHPEFVMVDTEGNRMNRAAALKEMERMFKVLRDEKSMIKVDKVEGDLNEFTAWLTMKVSFKVQENGKWTSMTVTENFAETLVRTSEGYKVKFSQMLPRDYSVPR